MEKDTGGEDLKGEIMAISEQQVKDLQNITSDLAELVLKTNPAGLAEWDAFFRMVLALQQLRQIDIDTLLQKPG